jgi:hypothetical protein
MGPEGLKTMPGYRTHPSSGRGVAFTREELIALANSPKIIRKKGKNDRIEKNRGGVTYYLFDNEIAHYDPERHTLMLTDAGFRTKTTKDRLNLLLKGIGHLDQVNYAWYFHARQPEDRYGWGNFIGKGSTSWNGRMLVRL